MSGTTEGPSFFTLSPDTWSAQNGKRIPLPGETWRHMKSGKAYTVLHLATDEATMETLIAYQSAYDGERRVWVRTLENFLWRDLSENTPMKDREPRFRPAELHPIGK